MYPGQGSTPVNGVTATSPPPAADSKNVRIGNVVIPKAVLINAGVSAVPASGQSMPVGNKVGDGAGSPPAIIDHPSAPTAPYSVASSLLDFGDQRAEAATAAALRAVDNHEVLDQDMRLALQLQEEEDRLARDRQNRRLQDEQVTQQMQQREREQLLLQQQANSGHGTKPSFGARHGNQSEEAQQQAALDFYKKQKLQQQQRQQQQQQQQENQDGCVLC
jgi:hypothetical protein